MKTLPNNWAHCMLEDFLLIEMGQSPSSDSYNNEGKGIPFYQGCADFGALYPITRKWCSTPLKIAEKNDLLLSVRAPVGTMNICVERSCIGRGLSALHGLAGIETKFIYFLLSAAKETLLKNSTGTTFLAITSEKLRHISVNLPPLAEQGRIVAKIEELFAGIDAGVENLKSVKNQIALYRQSVLKSAFLKVTAWEKLSNICLVIKVGPFGTMLHEADYISNGIPLVNPSQIKNSKILPKQDKCISSQKAEELKEYQLMQGDIVLGRRGEMGRCATVDEMEVGWLCGTGSILIRLKKQMNALFYNFFLASPLNVRYLEDNATGTTMKNLNEKIVANIPVPVPTLAEQEKIVAEIESRFERADALETAVDRALNDAEKLKQAVLKKAFSGELVPQNPDDEPASVLLDRIRAARASELPAKKGKQKKTEVDSQL